jgi:hypothetical protein
VSIPGSYTDSAYPLAYFFTVHDASGDAWIVPGFDETLSNQPYHVVRQERAQLPDIHRQDQPKVAVHAE